MKTFSRHECFLFENEHVPSSPELSEGARRRRKKEEEEGTHHARRTETKEKKKHMKSVALALNENIFHK